MSDEQGENVEPRDEEETDAQADAGAEAGPDGSEDDTFEPGFDESGDGTPETANAPAASEGSDASDALDASEAPDASDASDAADAPDRTETSADSGRGGSIPEADVPDEVIPLGAIEDRVTDADPGAVATEIAALREEVRELRDERAGLEAEREELESEREDLESRLKRKQAEFQNYKKRQERRREEERARATESLVQRLLEVRDNLDRALEQDADADIRKGIEATFRQLDEVLDAEGVEAIESHPGTETDPQRHEVLLRVESDRPEGTVDEVHRPGYEMAGKVLRPAQVTVSEGPADPADEVDADEGEADEDEADEEPDGNVETAGDREDDVTGDDDGDDDPDGESEA